MTQKRIDRHDYEAAIAPRAYELGCVWVMRGVRNVVGNKRSGNI